MAQSNKAQRTRDRLIEIAAERFAAYGYARTSFASLVEASGQSKGAFYFHFWSKLDLVLAAFRAKQSELLEALSASRGGSPLERLLEGLEARARAYATDRSLRVLPRLSTEFAQDPQLAPLLSELHSTVIHRFAGMVREGQEAGEVRSDLDPDAVARTIFATIVGMDEVSQRETEGKDLVDRTRDFLRLLGSALEARQEPQPSKRNGSP